MPAARRGTGSPPSPGASVPCAAGRGSRKSLHKLVGLRACLRMADANIRKMYDKHYGSDLTDQEYAILEPLLPQPKRRGRRRSVVLLEVLNAIFYILRG